MEKLGGKSNPLEREQNILPNILVRRWAAIFATSDGEQGAGISMRSSHWNSLLWIWCPLVYFSSITTTNAHTHKQNLNEFKIPAFSSSESCFYDAKVYWSQRTAIYNQFECIQPKLSPKAQQDCVNLPPIPLVRVPLVHYVTEVASTVLVGGCAKITPEPWFLSLKKTILPELWVSSGISSRFNIQQEVKTDQTGAGKPASPAGTMKQSEEKRRKYKETKLILFSFSVWSCYLPSQPPDRDSISPVGATGGQTAANITHRKLHRVRYGQN